MGGLGIIRALQLGVYIRTAWLKNFICAMVCLLLFDEYDYCMLFAGRDMSVYVYIYIWWPEICTTVHIHMS